MDQSLTGQLLVASPTLLSPEFQHSIVLMVQHGEEGALGLVINRPLETSIDEAWDQISEMPCPREDPLHYGGPCEGPLMVVHPLEDYAEMTVADDIYFCTDKEHIEWLLAQADEPMKFVFGYAGWVFFALPLYTSGIALGAPISILLVCFVVPASTIAGTSEIRSVADFRIPPFSCAGSSAKANQ